MKKRLVQDSDQSIADKAYSPFYQKQLIPEEKKRFLSDNRNSYGPFLGVKDGLFILDGASQIASHGLGFNPSSLFGVGHHQAAWNNDCFSSETLELKESFRAFLERQLSWNKVHMFLCNSGAEANEIALGRCFENRANKKAKKVLAFEGGFHGRMLVALYSTWNKVKREPFQWKGYETVFAPYPSMKSPDIHKDKQPKSWIEVCEQGAKKNFSSQIKKFKGKNKLLDAEVDSLLAVRKELASGKIFSVIVEPLQCEGGDNFGTARFYQGLASLVKSFGVPIIFDEVQTGFGLGGPIFWHSMFKLKNSDGSALHPDFVTLSKKAQVGVVLSHEQIHYREQYSVASLARGYIQGVLLDQYEAELLKIEEQVKSRLEKLVKRFSKHLANPRNKGLAFSFDFKNKELVPKFVAKRFAYGMLYYPAGSHTARFRLSLSYKEKELDLLFEGLSRVLDDLLNDKVTGAEFINKLPSPKVEPAGQYEVHQALVKMQQKGSLADKDFKAFLGLLKKTYLEPGLKLKAFSKADYKKYRKAIEKLEIDTYEPARRTDLKWFDKLSEAKNNIFLGIFKSEKLVAVICGAPLYNFPCERGIRKDSSFQEDDALYPLALTVSPKLQAKGMGRVLKYAFFAKAISIKARLIQGRNRDRHARGMLSINLSLGAYELMHFDEDYPDELEHRDAIYYTTKTSWDKPDFRLSNAVDSPLYAAKLSSSFIDKSYPGLVNKLNLSNFVNKEFVSNLDYFLSALPKELRHAYTTSGQSECVDKLVKSLWLKKKPAKKQLSFEGCSFGDGSFMSRSLSGTGEKMFPVTHLEFPTEKNWRKVLREVSKELGSSKHLAVWLEPIAQATMQRMPEEFLASITKLCQKYDVPLISNDTGSLFYRYSRKSFAASGVKGFEPDAGMSFLGGQTGVVYLNDKYFVEKPLTMISTWDGDEYALCSFVEAMKQVEKNKRDYFETRKKFNKALKSEISEFLGLELELRDGFGWMRGNVPAQLASVSRYDCVSETYLICPTYWSMKKFLQ